MAVKGQGMNVEEQKLNPFEARVDEVLQRKITSFRRIFLGTVVVGLGLFYFVVLPYLSSHTERSELLRTAKALEAELAFTKRVIVNHADVIRRLGKTENAAAQTREELINSGYHLGLRDQASRQTQLVAQWKRDFANEPDAAAWVNGNSTRPNLSAAFYHSHPSLRPPFKDPCFWLDTPLWTYCQISQGLAQYHSRLRHELGDTDPEIPVGFEMAELKTNLDGLVAPILRWATDPDSDAVAKIKSVRQFLSRSLEAYRVAISEAKRVAKKSATNARIESTRIDANMVEIRERVTNAEAKLTQTRKFQALETPIGKLPVGLDELVLLFPFVVTLVVCYLLDQLDQAMVLRRTLQCSLSQRAIALPGGATAYLRMTSALWLDPFDGLFRLSVQAFVLGIPLLAALVAAYIGLDPDFLFNDKVIQEPGIRAAIIFSYILAVGLLACLIWRLAQTVRAYQQWVDEKLPSSENSLS
jgi:hypothetical protein